MLDEWQFYGCCHYHAWFTRAGLGYNRLANNIRGDGEKVEKGVRGEGIDSGMDACIEVVEEDTGSC
jgi:hypothetical protein